MKRVNKFVIVPVLSFPLLFNISAFAADITWNGVNSDPGNATTDVNDAANWTPTTNVPGSGDTAIIKFVGTSTDKADLFISAADTNFDPDRIEFLGNSAPNGWAMTSDLYIDKDLDLINGFRVDGYGSNSTSGSRDESRLFIGTQTKGVTIKMSDLDISNNSASWGFFVLGVGDATANNSTVLELNGSNITFATPTTTLSSNMNTAGGGLSVENETNTLAPQMKFTNVGGTVTLESGGQRTSGALGLGAVHLDVRSDQTWIADDTAFINMTGSVGASGFDGRYVVESIDGGRLDNLGDLNIRINGNQSDSASLTTAMRLQGGTYGSLWMNSAGTSGRTQSIKLTDDVSFEKKAVIFDGAGDPMQSEYGLILKNTAGNSDSQNLYLEGHTLTVENSVLFEDTVESGTTRNLKILAENSTLIVKGDVVMKAAPGRSPGGAGVSNDITIEGGAGGVDFTLGGSWDVRTLAGAGNSSVYNLSSSTMTMTGGTSGSAVTFEVGDASATTGVQAQTWSIETLNIGNTGADTAVVQLVNDYLNNNAADKTGEKLIVGTLNIQDGSTFDANLSQASVEVGSTTLIMGSGAILDLNSGLTLNVNDLIGNFIGLGDQTATWNGYASQVIDSSNAGAEFSATLDGGNTVWQVTSIPEPSTLIMMAAGFVLLGSTLRRSRK